MKYTILAFFFFALISASFSTIYGACICRPIVKESFQLDQFEYYEVSVDIVTEKNQGAYLGNYFSYKIMINNLNNNTNSTKFDTFNVTLISPSNRTLISQQKTINITLGSNDSIFPEFRQFGAQALSWNFEEDGIYKLIIERNSTSETDNKTVIFVKFSDDCMRRLSSGDVPFITLIQPAPVYQREFADLLAGWQAENSKSQDEQSKLNKSIEALTQVMLYLTFALLAIGIIQLIKTKGMDLEKFEDQIPGLLLIVTAVFILTSIYLVVPVIIADPIKFFTIAIVSTIIAIFIWRQKLTNTKKVKFKWNDNSIKDALKLKKKGYTYRLIAKELRCSESTVGSHLRKEYSRSKPR